MSPDLNKQLPQRPKSLRVNLSWTFAGNTVYGISQWLMLVVLARLGSPEVVGRFALGMAVTAPVAAFFNLQLRVLQATDARREHAFGEYFALRLLGISLAAVLISLIALFSTNQRDVFAIILAWGLARMAESLSDLIYGLFQQHERMDCVARSLLLRGPLALVALTITMFVTENTVWTVLSIAITWAIVFVVHDVPVAGIVMSTKLGQLFRPRWHMLTLGHIFVKAIPVGLVTALLALQTNLPRYVIECFLGARQLGVFAVMASTLLVGMMFVRAANQSAIPRLARNYAAAQHEDFLRLVLKLLCLYGLWGLVGVILVIIAGPYLLTATYGPEYTEYQHVFVWLAVAYAVRFIRMPIGAAAQAMRRFWWQFSVHIFVVIVSIPACMLLIPRFGLAGAAYAIIITIVLEILAYTAVAHYVLRDVFLNASQTCAKEVSEYARETS